MTFKQEIEQIQGLIDQGFICPYCMRVTECIFHGQYGWKYNCKKCEASVGCHGGSKKAFGMVANRELKDNRMKAHAYFDPLWKRKMRKGFQKQESRRLAYLWLADRMGLGIQNTHIGMFDIEQCKEVVKLCKPYVPKLR